MVIAAFAPDGGLGGVLVSRLLAGDGAERILHVSMQLIAERFRRTALLKRMWGMHLAAAAGECGLPGTIVMRTCNPIVLQLLRGFTRVDGIAVYPEIDGQAQERELERLAVRLARRLCPGLAFDSRTGVLRGAAVPPDFYADLPRGRDAAVNAYFHQNLTTADRVLCIVRITTEQAKHRLLRAFGAQPISRDVPA